MKKMNLHKPLNCQLISKRHSMVGLLGWMLITLGGNAYALEGLGEMTGQQHPNCEVIDHGFNIEVIHPRMRDHAESIESEYLWPENDQPHEGGSGCSKHYCISDWDEISSYYMLSYSSTHHLACARPGPRRAEDEPTQAGSYKMKFSTGGTLNGFCYYTYDLDITEANGELTFSRSNVTTASPVDLDDANCTPSQVYVQTVSTKITEGNGGATYEVSLSAPPTSDISLVYDQDVGERVEYIDRVIIYINTDSQVETDVDRLTFYESNWDIPQTVTVTAVDDADMEGSHQGTITHYISESDGGWYKRGLAIDSVTFDITDNESEPAPQNLSAKANTPLNLDLVWDAVSGATAYSVYRAETAAGPWTQAYDQTPTNAYQDIKFSDAECKQTFFYKVSVSGQDNLSAMTEATVSCPVQVPAPQNLTVTAKIDLSLDIPLLDLAWEAVNGATAYSVYRADTAVGPWTQVYAQTSTSSYQDISFNAADCGQTFFYKVSVADQDKLSVTAQATLTCSQPPTGSDSDPECTPTTYVDLATNQISLYNGACLSISIYDGLGNTGKPLSITATDNQLTIKLSFKVNSAHVGQLGEIVMLALHEQDNRLRGFNLDRSFQWNEVLDLTHKNIMSDLAAMYDDYPEGLPTDIKHDFPVPSLPVDSGYIHFYVGYRVNGSLIYNNLPMEIIVSNTNMYDLQSNTLNPNPAHTYIGGMIKIKNDTMARHITAKQHQTVQVIANIYADPAHYEQNAELVMIGTHPDKGSLLRMVDTGWVPWKPSFANLKPAATVLLKPGKLEVPVDTLSLEAMGSYNWHIGYRLPDGKLIYTMNAMGVEVTQ